MGSHKYKGIRKTDGGKARAKKQAHKGIRQQGKNLCKNCVCDLNMFDFCRCP